MRKIADTILPTTMVGSYPRPDWFTYQLLGRDIRVTFRHADHAEAYADATYAATHDQESAGLDIITDGQMYFDAYVGSIGSFCGYMYERIRLRHEAVAAHRGADEAEGAGRGRSHRPKGAWRLTLPVAVDRPRCDGPVLVGDPRVVEYEALH